MKTPKLIESVVVGFVIMTRLSSSYTRTLNVIFTSCILASFLLVVDIADYLNIAIVIADNDSV